MLFERHTTFFQTERNAEAVKQPEMHCCVYPQSLLLRSAWSHATMGPTLNTPWEDIKCWYGVYQVQTKVAMQTCKPSVVGSHPMANEGGGNNLKKKRLPPAANRVLFCKKTALPLILVARTPFPNAYRASFPPTPPYPLGLNRIRFHFDRATSGQTKFVWEKLPHVWLNFLPRWVLPRRGLKCLRHAGWDILPLHLTLGARPETPSHFSATHPTHFGLSDGNSGTATPNSSALGAGGSGSAAPHVVLHNSNINATASRGRESVAPVDAR